MKTETKSFSSAYVSDIKNFIDSLYEKYGDKVVNLLLDGPENKYVLFYTIRLDTENEKTRKDKLI